jgi:hypothetical protein
VKANEFLLSNPITGQYNSTKLINMNSSTYLQKFQIKLKLE